MNTNTEIVNGLLEAISEISKGSKLWYFARHIETNNLYVVKNSEDNSKEFEKIYGPIDPAFVVATGIKPDCLPEGWIPPTPN